MCGSESIIFHVQNYDAVGKASKIYGINSLSHKPGLHWSLDKSFHIHTDKCSFFSVLWSASKTSFCMHLCFIHPYTTNIVSTCNTARKWFAHCQVPL